MGLSTERALETRWCPLPRRLFWANTALPQLRDSPRGSTSVSLKHKDISAIMNVERLCFPHWRFLRIKGAGGREHYIQEILSPRWGLNCGSPSKQVRALKPAPRLGPYLEIRVPQM